MKIYEITIFYLSIGMSFIDVCYLNFGSSYTQGITNIVILIWDSATMYIHVHVYIDKINTDTVRLLCSENRLSQFKLSRAYRYMYNTLLYCHYAT